MPAAPGESDYFKTVNAQWPDLANWRAPIKPPRNGVDRRTGKLLSGWGHCQQSLEALFVTPFHERVLRRWAGSFVPMILGRSAVERVITRFFWAIASAIDLWEPGYRVRRVYFMGDALTFSTDPERPISTAELLRLGQALFRQEGVWFPRGHVGDFSPFQAQPYEWAPPRPPAVGYGDAPAGRAAVAGQGYVASVGAAAIAAPASAVAGAGVAGVAIGALAITLDAPEVDDPPAGGPGA